MAEPPPRPESESGSAPEPAPDGEYLLEEVLCVHCLEVIPYDANLCRSCKAPQNFLASTLPYESIHAEGFILRTAAAGVRSWLVVLGIWLIFLPGVIGLVLPLALLIELWDSRGAPGLDRQVEFERATSTFSMFIWGGASALLIARTTVNSIRKMRTPLFSDAEQGDDPRGV